MRLSSIAHLYRIRLRATGALVQELLAVLGLAVGVGLLFAAQLSSASLDNSVSQLTRQLVGPMQLQLDARTPAGIDQRMLAQVRAISGVREAAPVLEEPANAVGPTGQRPVQLVGVEPRFALRNSPLLRHFRYAQIAHVWALAVPSPVAQATGVQPLEPLDLQLGARDVTALVGAELATAEVGALADSPVVIAPLSYAQHLAHAPGRLTRIFIQTAPGRQADVRTALTRLAAGTLNVEPADFDATLYRVAAAPANQGEGLFTGISALVGFIFAFSAMLLTVPLRRALADSLRANGATGSTIIAVLLFDALVLGGAGALLGLALGDALSLLVFNASPGYLSFAFPVGSERILSWHSAALAGGAGLLAAAIGVLVPLHRVFFTAREPLPAPYWTFRGWRIASALFGLGCIAGTAAILVLAPQAAVAACVLLVLAMLMLLPLALDATLELFDRLQARFSSAATRIAVVEIRSRKTRARSIAVAATAAVAVFGGVAIRGAQHNLQAGLDRTAVQTNSAADLWVTASGAENSLGTTGFPPLGAAAIRRLPGVAAVNFYRGGFLDIGNRRMWVSAPPASSSSPIPGGELTTGNLARASARIRGGGWAVVSEGLAHEAHLHLGEPYLLATAKPTRLRIAGFSTNGGWPPGTIIMNADDYRRAWDSSAVSALDVTLRPGPAPSLVRDEVARALGATSGLTVQTAEQRTRQWQTTSRQGLARLTQIETLVLIATVLSMAVAMGTMIWQRRPRFAHMKVQGYRAEVLWRSLLWESALLIGVGCAIGALFGVYGQLLISHALATVTGFPMVFSTGAPVAIGTSLLVGALALASAAMLGSRAVVVPAYA